MQARTVVLESKERLNWSERNVLDCLAHIQVVFLWIIICARQPQFEPELSYYVRTSFIFLCYLIKEYRNLIRLIILRNISGKCCFHSVTSQSLPLVLDCHFERRFIVNQNTQVLHLKCRLFTYKVMLSCF